MGGGCYVKRIENSDEQKVSWDPSPILVTILHEDGIHSPSCVTGPVLGAKDRDEFSLLPAPKTLWWEEGAV